MFTHAPRRPATGRAPSSHRTARTALGQLLLAVGLIVGVFAAMLPAEAHTTAPSSTSDYDGTWPPAGSGWQTRVANPALPAQCGLKVAILMDRSTSIEGFQAQYNSAADAIVDGLSSSPSSVGIWSFGTSSSADGSATYPSIDLTSVAGGPASAGATAVKNKITEVTDAIGTSTQYTNYEAGLAAVKAGANATPDLVIMLTDGAPTTHTNASSLTVDVDNADVDGGILSANAVKTWTANRTRILAIGLGSGVAAGSNAEKILKLVTGDTIYDGSNISTADYLLTTFAGAATALGQLTQSFCQANITVEKRASTADAPDSYPESTRANGWTYSSSPAAATANPADQQTGTIDAVPGRLKYTYNLGGATDITLTETVKSGYSLQGVECTKTTPNGSVAVPGSLDGSAYTVQGVLPTDSITCVFKNRPVFIDLSVTKTDGVAAATPGQVLDYTVGYGNAADATATATNVTLSETVPANTTYVASGSSAWSCADGAVAGTVCTLNVGSVAPGAGGTAHFKVQVVDPIAADVNQIVNTVTVTGVGAERDEGDQTATDTDTISGLVDLTVTKTDDKTSTVPGEVLSYVLSASTTGNKVATGVVLTETVPANTSFNAGASSAGWSCLPNGSAGATCTLALGSLTPGAPVVSKTFAVTVADPIAAGVTQIANTVVISGSNENNDVLPNTASDTDTLTTQVDLTVTKSDGGVSSVPGGSVVYSLGASAAGDQVATGVVLTETVPANSSFNAGASSAGWVCAPNGNAGSTCTLALPDLVPGAAPVARAFAVTVANPLAAGVSQLSNTVVISGSNENHDVLTNTASDTTPLVAAPHITVSKTDGTDATYPGDVLTYVITVTNDGNQNATGVQVVEVVPAYTSFAVGDPANAGWTPLGGGLYAQTIDLNVGAPVQLTFKVQVDASVPADADTIDNIVQACLQTQQCDTGDDHDDLVAAPELSVTKDDGVTTAGPGDELTYDIDYANAGDQEASDLTLTETVPVYTTADPAVLTGLGWVCDDAVPGTADVLEAGSTCTKDIGDLDGGADGSAVFTVTVDATVPVSAGTVVNLVGLVDDEETVDTDDDVDELTHAPAISVDKTDGVTLVGTGDTLVYTITVSNTGSRDAEGVTVTESVPEYTSFAAGAPGNDAWAGPVVGVYTQTVDVPAGQDVILTFTVQVDDTVGVDAYIVHNEVFACLDDDESCDDGDDYDELEADPAITVEKENEGNDDGVETGETIVYVITVSNDGDRDAEDVVVTETLPALTTFVAAAADNDVWTDDGGGSYSTMVDVAAGDSVELRFTVLVDATVPAGAEVVHNDVEACLDIPVLARTAVVSDEIVLPETCDSGDDDDDLDAAPDLSVVKSDGGFVADPGDEVTYTITYKNNGDQDATGVVLTETVPVGSTFVGPDAEWSCAAGDPAGTVCTHAVGGLAAGASGSIAFTVKVNATLAVGQSDLDNVVVVADDGENGEDPTPGDNTGLDSTPITLPTQVLPNVVERPTQVAPAALPRTGTDSDRMLLLAGVLTLLGGLLLLGESVLDQRRRRVVLRRR